MLKPKREFMFSKLKDHLKLSPFHKNDHVKYNIRLAQAQNR